MSPSDGAARNERIRFYELNAGYPGRPVLRQFMASMEALTLTALVGPNGSGRSTLLGVPAGVITATSGQLWCAEGSAPASVPQRGAVGDTLPLTARQTVEMGRWGERGLWRRPIRQDRAVVDSAIERLGVAELGTRRLGELPGGKRRRVLIAQGLAQQSDLLLLDEPTTGLDPEARERITALLTDLVADGTTVVQATHDLETTRSAGAWLLLSDGRLVGHGPPEQVLSRTPRQHPRVPRERDCAAATGRGPVREPACAGRRARRRDASGPGGRRLPICSRPRGSSESVGDAKVVKVRVGVMPSRARARPQRRSLLLAPEARGSERRPAALSLWAIRTPASPTLSAMFFNAGNSRWLRTRWRRRALAVLTQPGRTVSASATALRSIQRGCA